MKIDVQAEVDSEDLAFQLSRCMPHSELIEFVKQLDLAVQDWDFTLDLAAHFEELKRDFEREQQEIKK